MGGDFTWTGNGLPRRENQNVGRAKGGRAPFPCKGGQKNRGQNLKKGGTLWGGGLGSRKREKVSDPADKRSSIV